jgi:hypothetical protein
MLRVYKTLCFYAKWSLISYYSEAINTIKKVFRNKMLRNEPKLVKQEVKDAVDDYTTRIILSHTHTYMYIYEILLFV